MWLRVLIHTTGLVAVQFGVIIRERVMLPLVVICPNAGAPSKATAASVKRTLKSLLLYG